MPEGDTIHTVARVMAPDLVGRELVVLEVDQRVVAGGSSGAARVTACEAVGKHLLVTVTGAMTWTLRVHLGMKGSWHRYRPGELWRRTPNNRRVVLQTAEWLFVCFSPKEVALTSERSFLRPQVEHLGPDLLGVDFDLAEVVRRARLHPDLAIADVLLNQSVAAGIGNVYKSELCFLERVNPFTPSGGLGDDKIAAIYERARVLMRENLDSGGWRITTTRPAHATGFSTDRSVPMEQRHWVYRRARRPCHVCGTLIRSRLQGPTARMTYWCPTCQR